MTEVFEYKGRYYCFSKEAVDKELLYMGTSLEELQKDYGNAGLNIISLDHFDVGLIDSQHNWTQNEFVDASPQIRSAYLKVMGCCRGCSGSIEKRKKED